MKLTRANLIKACTKIAEEVFDNQMLKQLDIIKGRKGLHSQHKFLMINYLTAHNKDI